jgi:hypothetical protein
LRIGIFSDATVGKKPLETVRAVPAASVRWTWSFMNMMESFVGISSDTAKNVKMSNIEELVNGK